MGRGSKRLGSSCLKIWLRKWIINLFWSNCVWFHSPCPHSVKGFIVSKTLHHSLNGKAETVHIQEDIAVVSSLLPGNSKRICKSCNSEWTYWLLKWSCKQFWERDCGSQGSAGSRWELKSNARVDWTVFGSWEGQPNKPDEGDVGMSPHWPEAQPPPQPHPDTMERFAFSSCQRPDFILCLYPTFFFFLGKLLISVLQLFIHELFWIWFVARGAENYISWCDIVLCIMTAEIRESKLLITVTSPQFTACSMPSL